MNRNIRSIFTALLILIAPFVTKADSLRCNGDIIDAGVSEQQLIQDCGNRSARDGADWLYEVDGSEPMVVTMGNSVVMFIRGLDESDAAFGTHPLGDRP